MWHGSVILCSFRRLCSINRINCGSVLGHGNDFLFIGQARPLPFFSIPSHFYVFPFPRFHLSSTSHPWPRSRPPAPLLPFFHTFQFPSLSSLTSLSYIPTLPLRRRESPEILLGGVGERCKLLPMVWGRALAEIEFFVHLSFEIYHLVAATLSVCSTQLTQW